MNRSSDKRTSRLTVALIFAATISALIASTPVDLMAKDWVGGDGNDPNWTSNRNWAGLGGARPGDALHFVAGAARRSNLNDFPLNTSFSRLVFEANGYVLNGNQIALENGVQVYVPNGTGSISECNLNIALTGDQDWQALDGSARFNGLINLHSYTMFVDGAIVLNGQVTGGRIFKHALRDMTISGDADRVPRTVITRGGVIVTGTLGNVSLGGGTLRGTGSVTGINPECAACSGTIAPGTSAGTAGMLTVYGLASLNSTTTLSIDLCSPTSVDELRVIGGNLDLNSANLALDLGFTPAVGQQFRIASQYGNGNVTGQFTQGTGIVANSQLFTITYPANGVILTAQGPVGP